MKAGLDPKVGTDPGVQGDGKSFQTLQFQQQHFLGPHKY
jgi:hypothetical protein